MNGFNLIAEKINNHQLSFFDPVDLKKEGIDKFTKKELLELISLLNKEMIKSLDNWEGG